MRGVASGANESAASYKGGHAVVFKGYVSMLWTAIVNGERKEKLADESAAKEYAEHMLRETAKTYKGLDHDS